MLKDKVVLITGASSGIGLACAEEFARLGAHLLLCARRGEKLNEISENLQRQYGAEIYSFQLDVCDSEAVVSQLESLPDRWKVIDILVNNAGLAVGLDFLQAGEVEDWDRMIDTNLKGLLYVTRAILPGMVARDSGHIINIGSIAGHHVYAKGAVYCATKHAVSALTKGLRQDLLGTHVRVSSVDPGAVETNFSVVRFKGDTKRAAEVYEKIQPLAAQDIADAVCYCASRPPHVNITQMLVMPTEQAALTNLSDKN